MKNKLFTLLFALLASTTLFAIGRNDGSTKANAIDFDWDNGLVHYTGTKWYHLDLEPLYYGVDSLRFIITNPFDTESVDITCQTSIGGETNTVSQTIDTESSFTVWEFDPKLLVRLKLREIFFIVSSTGNVQLYWQRIVPSGDSCEEAKYPNCQDAETKWYAISAPAIDDRANVDSLVINFNNWDGDGANIISVSFKTDCNAPAFNSQTFTVPLYDIKTVAFSAELLASLGWPKLLFSCTSSTNCCIYYGYHITIPGESCEAPKDLAWNTVNHEAGTDQWYLLHTYGQIPENFDLRFHFTNTSTEVNSIAADILLDCYEPASVSRNYQLAPDEDYYIDIDRDFLEWVGPSNILLHFASNQDSRIWEELIPELPRDTFYDTIVSYVDYGETYLDTIPYHYQEIVILRDTTWNDTIEFRNGVYLMDSVVTFVIHLNEQGASYSTIADTYNMAQDSAFTLGAFDVVYVNGAYCYIKDATGYAMIYKNNYGLQAGDHVAAGMEGKINIYYGCYEITPLTTVADLTVTAGEIPTPMEATEVPSANNVNQYVVYKNVSFATDTAFTEVRRNTIYGSWNGQQIRFNNQFRIGATLQADKLYNITAFNGISNTNIRVYPIAVEEVSSDTPCASISGTCGENLTWSLSCAGVLTISGTGAMTDYEFDTPWDSYLSLIKTVVIGDGVTYIGYSAFAHCNHLTTVTIPNSVTRIGRYAFYDCFSLQSVTIPSSVTSIGNDAFQHCNSLTTVTIPNSVTSIEVYAFASCKNLTAIEVATDNPNYCSVNGVLFNKNLTTIVQYPAGKSETSYIIPSSVTKIGTSTFEGCESLTSVLIPNSVTRIESAAFEDCIGLTAIEIPQSVTYIGSIAFLGCTSLTSFEFPTNITSISDRIFMYCSNLTTITIPQYVTNIGFYAFYGCSSLNSLTCEAVVPPSVGEIVFNDVDKSIPLYVPIGSGEAYAAADQWSDFTNIQAVLEIPVYATIADTYNMAQDSAFTLGAFDVVYVASFQNGANIYIKDESGYGVIYKPGYGLQAGDHVEAGLVGKASIYHGLYEVIPVSAKENLTITSGEAPAPMEATEAPTLNNVNQYVVYKNVTFDVDTAFVEGLRHLVIGLWNNQEIYFYNQYYIGATLQANKAYNIIAVNTVYGTVPQAYPVAVEEVSGETPCLIASGTCGDNLTWELSCDSVLTISGTGEMEDGGYSWEEYKNAIKSVIINEGVTSIGYSAFSRSNLQSITIPSSVVLIRSWAFSRCNLTSVVIPNGVISIERHAFYDCTKLAAFYVDNSNANYSSLDGVLFNKEQTTLIQYPAGKEENSYTIPSSVTAIGKDAITFCRNLTTLIIPNSVINIGIDGIRYCYNLTSVTIPNSVTSIEMGNFWDCTILPAINVAVDNLNYCSVDGVLFNKEQTLLILYPEGKEGSSYSIPNTVTTIDVCAFSASRLTSITMPASVTSIRSSAFSFTNLISVTNYAIEPQVIHTGVFESISYCTLYVPAQSLAAYQAADVWKDFGTILPIEEEEPIETIEEDYNIVYLGHAGNELSSELVTLHLPVAPIIEGFSFLKWQVVAGDLEDGIVIQAVYSANEPSSAPEVYTNPANHAQKLIRNGHVYILKDDKVYTIHGQKVK